MQNQIQSHVQSTMVAVGGTPLVEVEGVYAKLECCNHSGSIKDRIAKYIIEESERRGILSRGTRIIEATSGNTGIALGTFGRLKGYPVTIVMPENMTEERKSILRDLGVELILCSEQGSFAEAASIRDQLAKDHGYFNTDQFSNPLNVECHYNHSAVELLDQIRPLKQPINALVAGVGTGGTLIGMGKRLREEFPHIKIVAVEPTESAVMCGGKAASHGINGIGDGFIPSIASDGRGNLHPLIDEVRCVSTDESIAASKYLAEVHGYCVGISSGANFFVAKRVAEDYGCTVTVFADGYVKYCSKGLGPADHPRCGHYSRLLDLPGLDRVACRKD